MAAGFDIFRTSNDRQNIASVQRSQPRLRAARRLGLHRAHPAEGALHAAPVRDLQRPALGLDHRPATGRLVGRVGSLRRRSPGTPATRASTRPRAAVRNTMASGRPGRHGILLPHHRRRRDLPDHLRGFRRLDRRLGRHDRAVSTAPRCGSTTASSSAATRLRGFAVGGIGPRDANTTDSLGGKYLLHRHRGTQLPARPAQGNRHPRQGLRRRRFAVGYRPTIRPGHHPRQPADARLDRHRHPMDIAVRTDPCRLRDPAPEGTTGTRPRTIRFSFGTRF